MPADLHLHSRASDGSHGLAELISLARKAGLDCFALTDHDYTGHLDQAVRYGRERGFVIIPGVEISAFDLAGGAKVHILGYRLGTASPSVSALCRPVLEQRHHASLRAIAVLRAKGFAIDLDEVKRLAWGDATADSAIDRSPVLYRQHVIAALEARGAWDGRARAVIEELYGPAGACSLDMDYPAAADAVAAIKRDGGLAVLAHPGIGRLWDLVPRLVECGLDGIELDHPAHDSQVRQLVNRLARKHGLLTTGGSDCHGHFGDGPPPGSVRCPASHEVYFRMEGGPELWFAEQLVRQAGRFIRRRRQKGSGRSTGGPGLAASCKDGDHRDLVSECDLAVDRLVRRRVRERWPADRLLTEEGAVPSLSDDSRVWILDPVDGTANFLDRGRDYTVSLALWEGRRPRFGLVYDVAADVLYRGLPGGGIARDGLPLAIIPRTRRVAPDDALRELVLDASLNTIAALQVRGIDIAALADRLRAHRSLGCASLAIVRIALGELDAYVSDKLRVWDWAAAAIILAEAGGVCVGLQGHRLDVHDAGKHPFLAAGSAEMATALAGALEAGGLAPRACAGPECAPDARRLPHPQTIHTEPAAELISG
jgi:fructose-1,6-bisphosphatase/inositol monophosphatase family enzyme/predicted metal-dependent phosphoesterase TrpH